MKKDIVIIKRSDGSTEEIDGYALKFDFLPGFDFVVHRQDSRSRFFDHIEWTVSEKTSGAIVCTQPKRPQAIKEAERRLLSVSTDWLTNEIFSLINVFNANK